uniref:Filamin-related n=1 Tax=Schistosoma mansoni TaxID=6183 RepID=A0A5K4F492_SCHMA
MDHDEDISDRECGLVESDEETRMAEKELAEDAQWKIFQKNTFTRWANEHLKKTDFLIEDLETDLSDGLRLVALVEVLSGHKFRHVNKKPTFRTQKLENVTTVLRYLEETEGLRLISIDSSHIVDCNLKLILGLIWTLILHYSISVPLIADEENVLQQDDRNQTQGPKQRLLSWVKQKLPMIPIRNFTTDWNDGVAIGALVDACAPGLCPDWTHWDHQNPLRNATEAMTAADDWLSIPQLIRPEEMVDPNVDEKSMMTYISQFPNSCLKEGAPLRAKLNPSKVRAYGPGLDSNENRIGVPAKFYVETANAGRGQLEVLVINCRGVRETCEVIFDNETNQTYSCVYEPRLEGEYRIVIKYGGHEIPNSPFRVNVKGILVDPSKVTVSGPGLQNSELNCVGRRTHFNVHTHNAGNGTVDCQIVDPHGRTDTVKPRITCPGGDACFVVEYTPKEVGVHKVFVQFAEKQIPNSPFQVEIAPKVHPELAYATGRGIQARGIRVQDRVKFSVHTERAGDQAPLSVTMTRADGQNEPVEIHQIDKFLWDCFYSPQRPGKYILNVRYGNGHIQHSPFTIVVGPHKKSSIRAFGPGLEGGVVNYPNLFTIVCNGDGAGLGFLIEGPSEAKVLCQDNGDDSAQVTYTVSEPGEYAVHVTCFDEDIPGSPYMPIITPCLEDIHPNKLRVYGPGVEKMDLSIGHSTEFYIDGLQDAVPPQLSRSLKDSLLHVDCHNTTGNSVPVQSSIRSDGTVVCTYKPMSPGIHTVYASLAGISLKGSPFRVTVAPEIQPDKMKLWGPGLQTATRKKPAHFFIDPQEVFSGENEIELMANNPVSVNIVNDQGQTIPTRLSKQSDNTVRIEYVPTSLCTNVHITPLIGGTPAKSSIHVPVACGFDISQIKVQNLDTKVHKASYVKFTVDASAIDPHSEGTVTAVLTGPDNGKSACQVLSNKDGTYICNYTPLEEGQHKIHVNYEGLPVPGSPFHINVVPGCDPNRVKAYGPGLENGPHLKPGVQTSFTVDLTGAGQGGLGLAVEGPSEAPIDCHDNRNGTCTVYYTPSVCGSYAVYVRFNDVNVPGSPFNVNVHPKVDPNQVRCYGSGLESGLLRAGWPAYFTVDTKNAGDARLRVMYTPKSGGELCPAIIQPFGGGSEKDSSQQHYYKVTYTPETDGPCRIEVTYDDVHVPGSPYVVKIRKASEPKLVRVLGAGIKGPVLASLPATFTVDAREAGMGDLTLGITDPKGQSVPVRVVSVPVDSESVATNGVVPSVTSLASGDVSDTGLLSCTYEPYLIGPHNIHVMFADSEVVDSPFTVHSVATGRADLCEIKSGIKKTIPVGKENVIKVDTSLGGKGRLTCQVIQHPINQSSSAATLLPVETEHNGDGTTCVYYTPTQLSELNVELRYGGQLIPNGEFVQKVVSPEDITDDNSHSSMYRPVVFRLPAPRNKANIEAIVLRPSGLQQQVPVKINDDETITITYDPVEHGMHELRINVHSPVKSGSPDSTITMPLQGSPYKFYVDIAGTGRITAYGPGLSHGVTSQLAEFTIVTKEAGVGGLSVSVEGPSKAEIQCVENADGTCSVSYLPLAPGQYTITIKFADEHIPGSPFIAKITGDLLKRSQVSMGAPSDIALEAVDEDIATLTASVHSASGREEPCVLKSLPNNRLGISFTPKEVGEHLVSVFQAGKHIANSPFRIRVSEKEIGDPRRVRVSGPGLISGLSNKPNQFTVDTRDAGYAGLSLSIEGPSNADIECHDNNDGTCTVIYTPTEPGQYAINVKYANVHVPNSPFCVDIGGEPSMKMMERITRRREASKVTCVGSRCELTLRLTDTNPNDLSATITSPSGHTTRCEIVPIDNEHYNIKFIPQEMGEHLVTVKHKGIQISGSPFHFTVGPITDGVANKVRAMGPGLQEGWTHITNEFTIYTREAGAGTLSIAMEGPSKAEIDCDERRDGSSAVLYRVTAPGTYICSLKFNDEHIPCSPFRIHVSDSTQTKRIASYTLPSRTTDVHSARSTSSKEETLQIGRPIAFTVHHVETPGYILKAKVSTPSGTHEDAIVQPIDPDQFVIRFVPREGGPHLVHVHSVPIKDSNKAEWSFGPNSVYKSIQGSPFRLVVSQHAADPGMVCASGEGLRRGKVDIKNSFFVNTTNAGCGVLNVTVDGPSKATVTSQEHDEGYAFFYTPTVPGVYEITIKYGGNFHISGSPFRVEVTGTPRSEVTDSRSEDRQSNVTLETVGKAMTGVSASAELENHCSGSHPELVNCQGLGLKYAERDRLNYFNVDASQAGNDVLLIGICGPKQASEEVVVKHLSNNQYTVSYRVFQSGKHFLVIKWGDQHIPGSPFVIDIP